MIMDMQNQLSDSQTVTVTAISTNVIDTSDDVLVKNLGGIEPLFLVVQCDVAATAAGAATLNVELLSDSTADLATSPTVHYASGALALAAFGVVGSTVLVIPLPFGDYERYLGVRYTVATGPLTAGKFSAFLTRDPGFWKPLQANNPAARN